MINLASQKGLRVGSAPDTFMGGAHQTCRKLIDDGAIGDIVGATAFMVGRGHEMWHPSPEFFYKKGGGPMFDMGPYYLTDLVQLLGPVETVAAFTRKTFAHRTITSQPLNGKVVDVEIPTHIAGNFQFQSGATGTMIMSFDVWGHNLPILEIYGTNGTLYVPDPNKFGGEVTIKRGSGEIENVPLTHAANEGARGIGMAEMVLAMQQDREHRCNEKLAYHVLDLMHAFHDSFEKKQFLEVESTCERPTALSLGLPDGELH